MIAAGSCGREVVCPYFKRAWLAHAAIDYAYAHDVIAAVTDVASILDHLDRHRTPAEANRGAITGYQPSPGALSL